MPSVKPLESQQHQTLPVEAFEHYMLADDRPEFPMCFFMRLTIKGELEFKPFQNAVRRALQRHELLSMRLRGDINDKTKKLSWEAAQPTPLPFINWATEGEEILYPSDTPTIDLHKEMGLRFFVRHGAAGTTILLQVHHAVCDAMAATRFLEDMVAYYGLPDESPGATHSEDILRPLDASLLLGRGLFHHTPVMLRRRFFADLDRCLRFFLNAPSPLAAKARRAGASRSGGPALPASVAYEFDRDGTAQIRAGAKKRGATINDLLLTELFVTLDHWQIKADPAKGRVPLRIAMPINMRKGGDLKMPAANVVSMCFLDRGPASLGDHDQLLRGVARETRDIKDQYLGMALIRVARIFGRFKNGMRHLTAPVFYRHTYSTAVLSNLGQPLKGGTLPVGADEKIYHGDLKIERLELMPPLRPGTFAAIGVVTYAGRMVLTLHYDARHLEREHAQEIMDGLVERIREMMIDPAVSQKDFRQRLLNGAKSASAPFWSLPIGKNVQPEARGILGQLPPAN